jgi:hypothetical protein
MKGSDETAISKIRVSRGVLAALKRDAAQQKLPLNSIVSQRLNASFDMDRYGGPSMESALATLADLERAHRQATGRGWLDDAETFDLIIDAWLKALRILRPTGSTNA